MTPLVLTPLRIVPSGCGVCGRPIAGATLGCERCGVGLHSGCFLAIVATHDEVERLMTTEQDVAVVCRGCRS